LGWYHDLVSAGDLAAAGYGAYLTASVRKGQRKAEWAGRVWEYAWADGCRDPHLANLYAALVAREATTTDRSPLTRAVEICDDALATVGLHQGRIYVEACRAGERGGLLPESHA
jgi:hypothetical protein